MKLGRVHGTIRQRVTAAVVVPSPTAPGLTPAERLALRLRRDATITGVCACGARRPAIRYRRGEILVVPMEHEHDCPAAGPTVERLAERLGDRVQCETILVVFEVAA